MEKIKIEAGEEPKVHIQSIGGDLRLTGREQTQFVAQAPEEGELSAEKVNDRIEIRCRSNCLVFLPSKSQVSIENVGGDVHVIGLETPLDIKALGGDLKLRRVGPVSVEQVGGDVRARKVGGDFALNFCGGDAVIEKVQGEVRIQGQGGDLRLSNVGGQVQATAGGDGWLGLSPKKGTRSVVQVGGDLALSLPAETSASILLQAGGDVRVEGMPEPQATDKGVSIQLADGEAEIELIVGGDAWLRAGEATGEGVHIDIGEAISERVKSQLAELSAQFATWGPGMDSIDTDRIGEQVRRSIRRSMRKSSRKGRHIGIRLEGDEPKVVSGSARAAAKGSTAAERMAVLKMLEAGKISGDQADTLLRALEGDV